jgi:hypothetical protein
MNFEDLRKITNCYLEKCNKEANNRKKIRDIWITNSTNLYNNYKNNIITKKEFITKINKLDDNYFKSIESKSIHQCEIDKCYDLLKVKLDHLASKLNYKKKKTNYTIDDYTKMLIMTNKFKNANE